MPYPGLLHPEPLWQATADPYLHSRHSDTVLAQSLWIGCALCALLETEQLRRVGAWRARCPTWAMHPNHLPGPICSVAWVHLESTVSGMPCVSSEELLSGHNPPGRCQPSRIPGRLGYQLGACHSLVEDAVFGARLPLAFWLWLSPACFSASSLQIFCLKNQLIALWGFPYI